VPLGTIGFSYDQPATAASVLTARHEGSVWRQFSSWAIGGVATDEIEELWAFDPERAREALDDHPGLTPVVVTEPRIEPDGGGQLVLIPGVIGTEADIEAIVDQLGEVDLIAPPDRLVIDVEEIHPTVSDAIAQETVDRLNSLTTEGVDISVDGKTATLSPAVVQSHLRFDVGDSEIGVTFDDALHATLESTVVGPVGTFVEPTFTVTDDVPSVLTPGEPPPVCCEAGVGEWLGQQILAGSSGPFGLQSRPTVDPALAAWADGSLIVEKVSEFTTPHNCCETRVRNIQRIADIVRGVYLVPGETISLNEYVGPRTVENGFFAAGAIRQGHLVDEVGGGVSQFATTIFNAAYFAGMDFVEYRSHSLYFSRYPYGREATISSPAPDLAMTNTTNHPILIWTSYTDESITVSMYSTKHIEIAELDQRRSSRGACTHVETDRQRTYPDGRVVVDTFLADYRPAEGIDCSGNPIPPPL
ncbi:MAG TPA: VanW family protein, partial [Acidimicrobiia bacterium]|nr:VanW family protein [Acidimicrobiia bacterium]